MKIPYKKYHNVVRYFLLTEKISEYSLCDNKENINELLFNDQNNKINNFPDKKIMVMIILIPN